MELAQALDIKGYPAPAGGCLLTEKVFSRRLKDLFSSQSDPDLKEIELLKVGRHFRISPHTKIVVGRNKSENEEIHALTGKKDLVLTSVSVPGPTVLFLGGFSDSALELAAAITVAYSDAEDNETIQVRVVGGSEDRMLMTGVHAKGEFKRYMI